MPLIILYSRGLSPTLQYSRLVLENPKLISAIVEFPVIPAKAKKRVNSWMLKRIMGSSLRFVVFNFMVTELYAVVSGIFGKGLKAEAKRAGIEVMKAKVIDQRFLDWLSSKKPDYIINASNNILKEDIIRIPKYGILNYHTAPLPHFRGAANYFWMLAEGLKETNATLHYVDAGLDTGDVILYGRKVRINKKTTVFSLWRDLRLTAYESFMKVMPQLKAGERIASTPQDKTAGKTRSFPKKEEIKRLRLSGRKVFCLRDLGYILRAAILGKT